MVQHGVCCPSLPEGLLLDVKPYFTWRWTCFYIHILHGYSISTYPAESVICNHSTTQRQPHRPIIFYDFCITIYWLLFLRSIIIINLNVLFIEFRWASCHRYCPFPQSQCVLMGWNKRNWYGSEFCFIEVTMKDEYPGQRTSWPIWEAAGLLFLSREGEKHAVKKRMVEMWIVIFEKKKLFYWRSFITAFLTCIPLSWNQGRHLRICICTYLHTYFHFNGISQLFILNIMLYSVSVGDGCAGELQRWKSWKIFRMRKQAAPQQWT